MFLPFSTRRSANRHVSLHLDEKASRHPPIPRFCLVVLAGLLALLHQSSALCQDATNLSSISGTTRRPRIAVIVPLTGKAAAAGEAVMNGSILANEALSNAVDLTFEDNQLEGARTASITKDLLSSRKIDGLIVYASAPAHVAAPLAEAAGVPMIGLSIDLNVSKGKRWVMTHWASKQRISDLLFSELKKRGLNKVAIVTAQVQGLLEIQDYFVHESPDHKVTIASSYQFLPSDNDFRATISLIKRQAPDAIFVNLYYGQAGLFAKQLAASGTRIQLFSHFVLDDAKEIASAAGNLEGAFFASTAVGDGTFDREYLERFGKHAVVGGIAGYDATLLFARACAHSKNAPLLTSEYLHSVVDFSGKIGTYRALPNNSFDPPGSVRVIRNGSIHDE